MAKTIIVAKDFDTSRKVIVSTLAKAGHEVIEASNGMEALALFDGRKIDLLITDFSMPRMSGGELIENVLALQAYQKLPVLLLSTEEREEKLKSVLNGKITDFVKKPFDKADLLRVVANALPK